ncbi:GNAT family N-acetyltransferase [Alkaliphilus serpentinus]|uniref:hypothetical protein n=1 Tax=Alkaliphilus serpentinus TaxID=1482731 RepID=UPI00125D9B16|nr:hypothetical protein [Alkaliphilus serpentinus]
MERLILKRIGLEYIDELLSMQLEIYHQLEDKDIFVMDTEDEMRRGLKEGGYVIGVFNEANQLVGYRYASYPRQEERNLGRDIGLVDDELDSVLQLETTIVKPEYRGSKLQRKTFNSLMDYLSKDEDKEAKYLVCTISPFNLPSLKNMLKCGFEIKKLEYKYPTSENPKGILRYILLKVINN